MDSTELTGYAKSQHTTQKGNIMSPEAIIAESMRDKEQVSGCTGAVKPHHLDTSAVEPILPPCPKCGSTYTEDSNLNIAGGDKLYIFCKDCRKHSKTDYEEASCYFKPISEYSGESNLKGEIGTTTKSFIKNDQSKPNLAILFDTPSALNQVANVMSYGAAKYNRKNWSLVDNKERYLSAALRHLSAYASGELIDPESSLSHLAHATTSILFLTELEEQSC